MDGPYDAPISKVGQVSIPRPIRDALKLGQNSRVHFLLPDFINGVALLVPDDVMRRWLQVGIEAAIESADAMRPTD